MLPLPSKCPFCGGEVVINRLSCRECDTTFEGRFASGLFSRLNQEQLKFVETFVRYEGKITHMEGELGLSYPTIRNRLHEVIRTLGFEPGGEETVGLTEEGRRKILERLDRGEITPDEAMRQLQESEG